MDSVRRVIMRQNLQRHWSTISSSTRFASTHRLEAPQSKVIHAAASSNSGLKSPFYHLQQSYMHNNLQHQRAWHSTVPISDADVSTNTIPEERVGVDDYFAIFDVPHRYDLDLKKLKQKYLQLMNEHHPDKQGYGQQQQQQQNDDESLTANDITNAYQILTEPHTRADHLLELIGHAILEDNNKSSPGGAADTSSSALVGMEFLLQVMEYRERIETLALCNKEANDGIPCSCGSKDREAELQQMYDATQQLQHACEASLAELWRRHESNHGMSNEELEEARTLTAQLQYWHRLESALKEEIEL